MSNNVWKVGAWAADSEQAEAEERERERLSANPTTAFPSLTEAAAVTKPKKKKGQTMNLQQFNNMGSSNDFSMESNKWITPDKMLRLPTGPKERSAQEMEFKSYGPSASASEGSWGGAGGYDHDDERRPPSRADEVDNWAIGKKPISRMDYSGRQEGKYSSLGSGGSRADEVDNWALGKKPIVVRPSSSFRDTAGMESDRWVRGLAPPLPRDGGDHRERTRLVLDKPSGVLNDNVKVTAAASSRPSPFGVARPREDVLAEKGLDWKKLDSDIEARKNVSSRPTSSHSGRPESAHSNRPESPAPQGLEGIPKARPKVNPFGDAKPREILLQEKGKDWRKMDLELEHRGVDRKVTQKEEIDHLKKELENDGVVNANVEPIHGTIVEQAGLSELLLSKEKDLELLICELDDKVRFGEKASGRPGSGAGRIVSFPDRPPSQSGRSDEYRNVEYMVRSQSRGVGNIEYMDRPQSHGTGNAEYMDRPQSVEQEMLSTLIGLDPRDGNAWTRPVDDRRGFQGGRERGFLSSREDRPGSREGW
ncbi:hypothetical protein IFM89_033838 [Coptis chinensis]|uniref:Uncharacterized protein n=1 Tax=Coptis chinensis TaxID=261450 RepID=A0A835LPC5_9MAGN|nr:hypothetical protein IFM89_033838 [Coptis chinensis]